MDWLAEISADLREAVAHLRQCATQIHRHFTVLYFYVEFISSEHRLTDSTRYTENDCNVRRWRLLWRLIWLIQSLIYFSLRKAAKAAYYPTIFVCFLAELFYKSKPYEGYDEQRLNRQHGLQLRNDASFSLCIIPTARCQLKLSVILNYPYGICCCELIITFANADVMWSSRFVYYSVILSVCILTKKSCA